MKKKEKVTSYSFGGSNTRTDEKKGKQTRGEKKSRKAMQKLGMKSVPGIIRVTIKKSKTVRT